MRVLKLEKLIAIFAIVIVGALAEISDNHFIFQ